MQTTKKDFDKFKVEFLKWAKKFGLMDIHFNFVHVDEPESYAHVVGNINQKAYVVFLSKTFLDMKKLPKGFINYLAYHEACECLLYNIRVIASEREFDENILDAAIHDVINRLEKIVGVENNFSVNVEENEE